MIQVRTVAVVRALALIGAANVACAAEHPVWPGAEQDYVLHCRGCHGADGSGVPQRVPSVRGTLLRFMRAAAGREFVLRVPGAANSSLSDAALTAVVNWMALVYADGEDTSATLWFSTTEVASARRHPLLEVRKARSVVVRELAANGIPMADDY